MTAFPSSGYEDMSVITLGDRMDVALALRAFLRTVERGSVTAAARDLAVSQPAVTKHLRNLERHVGARLLERSARLVRPTPQGRALYEASRLALDSIDAALEGVRQGMGLIEGRLRLHAPSCLGAKCLPGLVMAFQRAHPRVTVDLLLENREIDLVHENLDLAIRYDRPSAQTAIVRRLGTIRRIVVAAPDLLARTGPIDAPARLAAVPVIASVRPGADDDGLTLRHRDGTTCAIRTTPILRTNNAEVITATLRDGHAAGSVQQILVNEELRDGRLVRLLPDYEVPATEAYLAYPSVRYMRPAIRAFTDFVVPALRAIDGIVAPRSGTVEAPDPA